MEVKVLNECGYDEAILGLSLSYYDHAEPLEKWWDDDKKVRAKKRAKALAFKGGGHNKFLASIFVWGYVKMTRMWWSEYDTYKIGGITANSSSTMHTLDKRHVTVDDFVPGVSQIAIDSFNFCLEQYKDSESIYYKDISRLKSNLPEGWLQERQVCLNYMTLQNMIAQRHDHRLKEWRVFCKSIIDKVEHPELLVKA